MTTMAILYLTMAYLINSWLAYWKWTQKKERHQRKFLNLSTSNNIRMQETASNE